MWILHRGTGTLDLARNTSSAQLLDDDDGEIRKNEVVRLVGSYSKLNRLTGWSPKVSLEDVLQEMLEKVSA